MSSESKGAQHAFKTNTSSSANDSSSLNFTSSDSNDNALSVQPAGSPSKSTFQWPSEPLNEGRPSLPQDSQQSVEDANREISQRITEADHDAASQPEGSRSHPGLAHPRRSTKLTATLDDLEEERKLQLSPTATPSVGAPTSSLPMLSPRPQSMHRTSSTGTNTSAASDRHNATSSAPQYPSFLPDMFRNAASMPLNLLRSLLPDKAFPTSTDEGLSASTLQVPVTSFNALFEACKALEWLANQASQLDAPEKEKGPGSHRNSSIAQQYTEDSVDFAYFDYLQLLQKVADVVSGLAASRGIDLVLDLDPQLQGQPADNQRHYKLGSCKVWADRHALTFLLMSCLSRLLHNAPVQSTVVISSTLTPKEENIVRPDTSSEMKLMILTLGLRLILPPTQAATTELMSSISSTPASFLLDAFGARLTTEHSTTPLPGSPVRAVIDHSISVPVGQLPDVPDPPNTQKQPEKSQHSVEPEQEELADFAKSLQRNKVALYSTSQSIFARRLSTFLSGFGCDVAPVFTDNADEVSFHGSDHVFGKSTHTAVALTSGRPALVSYTSDIDNRAHPASSPSADSTVPAGRDRQSDKPADAVDTAVLDPVTGVPVTFDNSSHQPRVPEQKESKSQHDDKQDPLTADTQIDPAGRRVVPFSFVIIDDDIVTLQKELLRIRSAVPLLKSALGSKSTPYRPAAAQRKPCRPTLDHRTRSTPQVNRLMASQPSNSSSPSFASVGSALMNSSDNTTESLASIDESVSQTIIFFTSMKSYRLVRDTVQPIIDSASFRGVSSPPEIMVLPKPAGPKRILTALYVAHHKPVVRLPFLPIATSPLSPLVTHSKNWWTPSSSRQEDDQGIMTLQRRDTASTETDFDTTPSTPWSPMDAPRPTEDIPTPEIPLTAENLPLAGETVVRGPSAKTVTRDAGVGAAPSSVATTTKSALASTASRRTDINANANAARTPASASAGATSTQRNNIAGSAAASSTSPVSSIQQARSQPVSSPMPADALEYFSETAAKMGGSAASGMVIQSPDGRPAGIFFQPKASLSTPSLAGSKPTLSRGVSASSLRRGHQTPSEHSERSDSAARERRTANRSTGSTGGSARGGGTDGHLPRAGNLHTVSEQTRSSGSTEQGQGELRAVPLPLPGSNKYPSGSMFAPEVGIQSVLSSSRPPMTTPLAPSLSSQPQDSSAGGSGSRDVKAAQDVPGKSDGGKQARNNPDSAVGPANSKSGAESKTNKSAGPGSTKSAQGARPPSARQPAASGSDSANASPNARNSTKAASRVAARQSLKAAVTASPSDPKNKPSAVPQSGFMMGMGFAAPARRGRGPKKAPAREAVLPPIKVLIVEDNPINQRILSTFMGKKKIKFDVANNGREAVDKWKTGGYHLILMDIQLPVMDGIEATKEIRKLERSANIGILPNTPPAGPDSRVDAKQSQQQQTTPSSSSLSGGSRRLTAKGLMKHAVAGSGAESQADDPKQKSSSATGGPNASSSSSALVNGVGEANTIPVARTSGSAGAINPFRASVIIVALTASVLSSDRVEALAAGCNDFLNKPVSLPWLNQKILEWGSMMYLMYSGLSSDDVHLGVHHGGGNAGGGGHRTDRAQLHLGFGYGPAEKAKTLANNLHLGDKLEKMKKRNEERERMERNRERRDEQQQQRQRKEEDASKETETRDKQDKADDAAEAN
ncbi:hypothetical protein PHSY_003252 [Pseudozyma hubeiensis SY62]|uniref:Response regulatory domain-containing protein n=1 Tax=Pseudozyma hubeiensis (strain SY62) TaxID=1305764 RepID=R9P2V7_PSEHS|nr:hypothetical protein PHSY_003252 [Pseudozyma hubeiensis SY62]GAC95676.1 hypothetical protein PHSY_003252 [Pseudozyma hubeiensis SY62]